MFGFCNLLSEKMNSSGSANPSMNNNKSAPKLSWRELNNRRAYFGVLSAPAPHLRHTLPKIDTKQQVPSVPAQMVPSGRTPQDPIIIDSSDDDSDMTITYSGDEHSTGGYGASQAATSCDAQSSWATNYILVPYYQVRPSEASTSNSGAHELPQWAKFLQLIPKMRTNSGAPIRNAIRNAIACNPPAAAKAKLEFSISAEVFKGNNASRTKNMALEVLDAEVAAMLSRK